jgi:hypothetical protein
VLYKCHTIQSAAGGLELTYPATVVEVMIASPGDVGTERNIIREVIFEWNVINSAFRRIVLLPRGWETHSVPSMGEPPQATINKQVLAAADLLVGVFWTRIGTATDAYASGSVEEIEEHIKTGKPAMLYFSNAPVRPDSVDSKQYEALQAFKKSCEQRALYETYMDYQEFRNKFARQLSLRMNEYIVPGGGSADVIQGIPPAPAIPQLSHAAQILLKEASKSKTGQIVRFSVSGGIVVQVNGQAFSGTYGEGRQRAELEGALDELEGEGLISDPNGKRVVFELTAEGFKVADLINP